MAANIYQAVKQAMQDLIAPQLESLRGEILAGRADTQALRAEMNANDAALRADITALRAEMRAGDAALHAEIRRIDEKLTWALDLRERIALIEGKLAASS